MVVSLAIVAGSIIYYFIALRSSSTTPSFSILDVRGNNIFIKNDGKVPIEDLEATLDGAPMPVTIVLDDKGLVGYWSFYEGEGERAADSSLNENDGVVSGATWTEGVVGTALDFDGDGDTVDPVVYLTMDANQSFTFATWLKLERPADDTSLDYVFYLWEGSSGMLYKKYQSHEQGRYVFVLSLENGTELWTDASVPGDPRGWHHHALVYDDEIKSFGIYIDGTLKKSTGIEGHASISAPLSISGPDDYSFYGAIDEVQIYNRTLSDTEIRQLHSMEVRPGEDAILKILSPMTPGEHTIRLCSDSFCHGWIVLG